MNKQKKRLGSMSLCKVVLICLFLSVFSTAWAAVEQTSSKITVTGVVKDVQGEPLIGATIKIKGSAVGTVSDFDGNYSLANVPVNGVLEFSYVGMNSIEISVSGKKVVNAVLSDATQLLDQVVVIGYGSVKKSDLTGSVATVKPEALSDIPANSVEGLLQGRAAGVQVINSSQDPGAGSTVRIRGNSSLRGSNSPLIVVDGFPLGDAGDLKQINTDDIVSMEVLKDASASAIYGSRGANGVIIVTTRRAKEGTTTVSVKQQLTFSEFSSKLDLWRDPVMMAMLNNEGRVNGGLQPLYIGANNSAGVYYPSIEELQTTWTTNTRWDELVFRDAPVSNNTTVSVSSANEKTSFNLSANYYTDQGMYIDDDYSKGGYNLNVSHKIYKNFTIRASNILYLGNRNNNGGMAYWRNPIYPVYNEDGTYYQTTAQDYSHPIAIREHKKDKTKMLDVISSGAFEWQVIPQLRLTSQLNYKYGKSTNDQYLPQKYTQVGTENRGRGVIGNTENQNFVSETFANYSQMFGKHEVGAMVGHSYEWYQYRDSYLTANGFVNEALGNENMGAGEKANNIISNGFSKSKLVSGMARLNYTYDNKYLLTATFRADGSSKFGKNNKWGYFPAVSAAWRVGEEDFIKKLNVFSDLKFRIGYGLAGNNRIGSYNSLALMSSIITAMGDQLTPGYASKQIPNPDLKWEANKTFNMGVDLGFLNQRITVSPEFYINRSSNLLLNAQLPYSSGYQSMLINAGETKNVGVELTVNTVNFSTKKFSWNTTLTLSHNKNSVKALTGEAVQLYEAKFGFNQNTHRIAVGEPLGQFYGYITEGLYQVDDFNYDASTQTYTLKDGVPYHGDKGRIRPGMWKFKNLTGDDNVIDENDKTVIGNAQPKFYGGLNNSFTYKGFDLSIFLTFSYGNEVLNATKLVTSKVGSLNYNALDVMNSSNRWMTINSDGRKVTDPGELAALNAGKTVAAYHDAQQGDNYIHSWAVEDASYLKLSNVTLGYTFPKNLIARVGLKNLRLYATGNNLLTWTKYSGFDPEVSTMKSGLTPGVDFGAYPLSRSFIFGLNVAF